jgi:hypothetical protein
VIRVISAAPHSIRLLFRQVECYAHVRFAQVGLRSRVSVKDGPLGRGEIQ